jgi:hypothetical protein
MPLRDEAEKIAANVPPSYGDPLLVISIIEALLSIWSSCQSISGQSAKSLVASRIKSGDASNPDALVFRRGAIARERKRARQAASQSGDYTASREKLDGITVASWRHILASDDQTVSACCAEGAAFGAVDPGESDESE